MATKPRQRKKPSSAFRQLLQSSWTKVLSVILTIGAIASVFWGLDQRWVNFPFHQQTAEMVLTKSNHYTKQLDMEKTQKLAEVTEIIRDIQRDQKIQTCQNQINFLYRHEMLMREAMARLAAAGKPISPDFKAALARTVAEREGFEQELSKLIQR